MAERNQDRERSVYSARNPNAPRKHVNADEFARRTRTSTPPHPQNRAERPATGRAKAQKRTSARPYNPSSNSVLFVPEKSQFNPSGRVSRVAPHTQMQRSASPIRRFFPVVITLIILIALVFFVVSRIRSCSASNTEVIEQTEPSRVSFIAVGDNLPEETIGTWADAQAGESGDGTYDYTGLYAPIKEYIEGADLAYCKQETHCGGDEIGPKGYPSFNTTDAMADAIVSTGFDLVASASNHCYDWGSYGANEHSCNLWSTKDVTFTGTYTDETAYNTIATTTVNGITFSLLDYTYGVNGYTQDELPDYCVKFIDKDLISTEVAKARSMSDVVIVAMHWGTENQTEPDETQLEYAQLLADLGVDVIVGSHPHVIGPLAWIEGSGGNKTLCAYSLGNFVSAHETPSEINELEGALSCTFVKEYTDTADASSSPSSATSGTGQADYTITIEDVTWIPLVNHTTADDHAVYALKDYTEDLAAAHTFLGGNGAEALSWLRSKTEEVVNSQGTTFDIDDGQQDDASSSSSSKHWFIF